MKKKASLMGTSAELINFFVLVGVDALDGSMGGKKQFVDRMGEFVSYVKIKII